MPETVWFNFAVALALGLLIGVERERSKGEGPNRRSAGVRTFALASLLGALAIYLGGITLLAVASGAVAGLVGLSYFRNQNDDPGLTSEVGMLVVPLLGALAMSDALLASAISVAVAVIFTSKDSVHGFIKNSLSEYEFRDGLILAIATLIVWPQLPDHYMGPFQAINPHMLWLLVILVLVIGACGHIAVRVLGDRYGLPIAGLASGFVSSTATIGSMAGNVAKEPGSMKAAVAGAALSTVATFVQLALLLFAINPPTLTIMAPALISGGIFAALYGLVFTILAFNASDSPKKETGDAFSIKVAFGLTATMAIMLIIAAALKDYLGEPGIIIGAAVAGFVDAHSAAVSISSLVSSGKITQQDAVWPIMVGMTSNAIAKGFMAASVGSLGYTLRVVPGLVISLAAAWGAVIILGQ